MTTKQDIINNIVATSRYFKTTVADSNGKNKKVIIDLFTAGLLKQVFDHVQPELVAKLNGYNWIQLSNVAFKIANK